MTSSLSYPVCTSNSGSSRLPATSFLAEAPSAASHRRVYVAAPLRVQVPQHRRVASGSAQEREIDG